VLDRARARARDSAQVLATSPAKTSSAERTMRTTPSGARRRRPSITAQRSTRRWWAPRGRASSRRAGRGLGDRGQAEGARPHWRALSLPSTSHALDRRCRRRREVAHDDAAPMLTPGVRAPRWRRGVEVGRVEPAPRSAEQHRLRSVSAPLARDLRSGVPRPPRARWDASRAGHRDQGTSGRFVGAEPRNQSARSGR